MKRRVVVTGQGVVTQLGHTVQELWTRICNGESGIHTFVECDNDQYRTHFGGEIVGWDTGDYMPPKEARRIDRFAQFAVVGAYDAVAESGLDFSKEDPFRCGTIIGSGIGGLNEIEEQHGRLLLRGPDRVSPFTIPKLIVNAASGQVSINLGTKGVNYAVSTACASASNAIGEAFQKIQYGMADVVITGGSEAAITPMGVVGFGKMKAISEWNDRPEQASRPFDLDRNGFVMAEGAGILVLEEYERAKARGANIIAEIYGFGATADAGHITQPDENGIGAAQAMRFALEDAGVNPEDIDYINAHGTSTPLGDKAEVSAIKNVFGDHAYKVSVSSTKSQLGHMLGASGGVELIMAMCAIRDNLIPPTINYDTPDPACDLDFTPNVAREREVSVALSNSFGFGGHNACLVVGKVR